MLKILKTVYNIVPFATIYVFLYEILNGIFVATRLYLIMNIIQSGTNYIMKSGDINQVLKYGLYFILAVYLQKLAEYFYAILMNGYLYEKTGQIFKHNLAEKLSKTDLINFEDREFLTNLERANTTVEDERIGTVIRQTSVVVGQILSVILIILTLSSYSIYLVFLGILTVIPYFITRLIRGKAFYSLKYIEAYDNRKLDYYYSLFTNKISNRDIRLNDASEFFLNKYINVFKKTSKNYFKEKMKDARSLLFCDILSVVAYSIAIIITIKLTIDGNILIGMMGACLIAYQDMQRKTKEMIEYLGYLPQNISFANDYIKFMETKEDDKAFDVSFSDAKLNNTSFNYPNTDNGIKDITFEINEGDNIAIVGYNGSGKTTFTKVLTGIYDSDGEIFYGNKKINNRGIKLDELSIVPQERSVTNLTIGEHVAASENYDEEKVKTALDYVGLSYVYEKSDLDTRIGKEFNGIELSGGERERLDIARAIYKDAKLLILDEPTSALDPMEESRILRKFLEISKEKTSIIVTHRLGICKFVDKIVVLKEGKLIATGVHDELLKTCDYYREMYEAQSKFYN